MLKGLWREAEAWHHERPVEGTDEGADPSIVEIVGLWDFHQVQLQVWRGAT